MPLLQVVYFFLSVFLLWFGAEWIVESAAAIARKYNVSELVIGLTVVAMGTSAPEFLVTATAAFQGLSDISLSNVVGSNIFNLGFILGLMAVITTLPTHKVILYRDGGLLFGITSFILLMAWLNMLGRVTGIILMLTLAGYVIFLIARRQPLPIEEEVTQRKATWIDYPKLLIGFCAIALGGHLMVGAATTIAQWFGVSNWVIGVTIVAAGTSLPELVTCLSATLKRKNDMMLGNLIGSDLFNFAGVLGLTCFLKPLNVSAEALPSLMVLVGMIALVLVFIRTGWRVTRLEGAILIGINLIRWGKDFIG